MGEICASGSVGGEGGNVLAYPAAYTAMPREKAQAAQTARPKVPMRRSGADCSVVVMKRGNARGAKGAGHRRWERANWQQDELQFSTEGGSLRSMARAG